MINLFFEAITWKFPRTEIPTEEMNPKTMLATLAFPWSPKSLTCWKRITTIHTAEGRRQRGHLDIRKLFVSTAEACDGQSLSDKGLLQPVMSTYICHYLKPSRCCRPGRRDSSEGCRCHIHFREDGENRITFIFTLTWNIMIWLVWFITTCLLSISSL